MPRRLLVVVPKVVPRPFVIGDIFWYPTELIKSIGSFIFIVLTCPNNVKVILIFLAGATREIVLRDIRRFAVVFIGSDA